MISAEIFLWIFGQGMRNSDLENTSTPVTPSGSDGIVEGVVTSLVEGVVTSLVEGVVKRHSRAGFTCSAVFYFALRKCNKHQ